MGKPVFREEYPSFGPFDQQALGRLVRSIDRPFKRILEVGSWLGTGSTRALIEELKGGRGALYCVDTWQGTPNVERHQELVREYDVFGTFLHNVVATGGADFVKPMMMTSLDAAAIVADASFNLVFLDGDHSYTETTADIRAWLPKVGPGGILCGHDCETRLGDQNRERLFAHRDCDGIPGEGPFVHYHPGVILAVDEFFRGKAHLWAEEEIVLRDGTHGMATIWDIRVDAPGRRPGD